MYGARRGAARRYFRLAVAVAVAVPATSTSTGYVVAVAMTTVAFAWPLMVSVAFTADATARRKAFQSSPPHRTPSSSHAGRTEVLGAAIRPYSLGIRIRYTVAVCVPSTSTSYTVRIRRITKGAIVLIDNRIFLRHLPP